MNLRKFVRKWGKVSVFLTLLASFSLFVGASSADRNNPAGLFLRLATLSSPTDSTITFDGKSYDYSFYCSGDTVSFELYKKVGTSYIWIKTITLSSGITYSTSDGPRIDRVVVNRPDSVPEVLVDINYGAW